MKQRQYDKATELHSLMTVEKARTLDWEIVDVACSEKPLAREAQLAKLQAKHPIHFVEVVILHHPRIEYGRGNFSEAYYYPRFAIKRNESRVMGIVEKAIESLRSKAVKTAERNAHEFLDGLSAKLRAVGWDLDKLVPLVAHPVSQGLKYSHPDYGKVKRAHEESTAQRNVYLNIFYREKVNTSAVILRSDPAFTDRFVRNAIRDANYEFDVFLFKMVKKIGNAVKAEVTEQYGLMHFSLLKVTLENGTEQTWKTQQIVNYSVLGKAFNQWPTRMTK